MTGTNILISCQNKQECEALQPVADKLRREPNIAAVDFLSQDDIYAQGVTEFLLEYGESPFELGLPFQMRTPYTGEKWYLKLVIYRLLYSALYEYADNYGAIISGVDGLPIRILSQHSENTDTKIFQLIVSSHNSNSESSGTISEKAVKFGKRAAKYGLQLVSGYDFLTYPSTRGGSHSGLIFTPGRKVKQSLMESGIEEDRIQVTGIPRFKPLFSNSTDISAPIENEYIDILYLPGAFKMHGYEEQQMAQYKQIEIISSWISKQTKFRLTIKPHPREDSNQYNELGEKNNVSVKNPKCDLYEAIRNSDIVTTIASTAAYEAVLLRRPVIKGLFPYPELFRDRWNVTTEFPNFHSKMEYVNKLNSILTEDEYIRTLKSQIKVAHQMIDPATPDSDEIISNTIINELK